MSLNDLMTASNAGTQGSDVKSVARSLVNEPAKGADDNAQRNEQRERGERRVVTRGRTSVEDENDHATVNEDEGDDEQDDLFRSPSNREVDNTDNETDEDDENDDLDDDNRSQEDEDDQDADSGTDDEGEEDGDEYLSDETLIDLTIDGEETQLSLAELKRRAAGEGAIDRRLQEATELRNSVEKERREHEQNVEHDRGIITAALQLFQDRLFHPQVQQPDPSLQQSDPQEFTRQLNAFQMDQQRLHGDMQQFQQVMQTFQQQQKEQETQLRRKEASLLRDKMPVFKDPVQGPKMRKRIIDTAKQYGFTEEDVSKAMDHRLFLMASEAASFREIMAQQGKGGKKQNSGKQPPAKGEKRIRTMRPGGKSAATRGKAKQEQAIIDRARKTGDVKDVARTLIQTPSRRRR